MAHCPPKLATSLVYSPCTLFCPHMSHCSRHLGANSLTGTIPTEVGLLKQLRTLFLYSNQFSGPIPDVLTGLPYLEHAYFHYNNFAGLLMPFCPDPFQELFPGFHLLPTGFSWTVIVFREPFRNPLERFPNSVAFL